MEWIYYLRDNLKRPIITVCLLENENGMFARGIALCSNKDQPCKRIGRTIAKGRAVKALLTKTTSGRITRNEAFDVLDEINLETGYSAKSFYNTIPLEHEKFLFKNNVNI